MEEIVNQNIAVAVSNKKKSLKRYRKQMETVNRLKRKLKNRVEKLEELDSNISSIKSPNYSGMPRGGTPITIADLLADKEELERDIEDIRDRLHRQQLKAHDFKLSVCNEIDMLSDPKHNEVLEAYFVDRLPMDEVASQLGYTGRNVYKLYSRAIEELITIDSSVNVQ